MPYTNSEIKYTGTVSGSLTSATPDEIVPMQDGASNAVIVGTLSIEFITAGEIKVNSEDNYHAFSAGQTFNFGDIRISQIVIKDAGTQIVYHGAIVE